MVIDPVYCMSSYLAFRHIYRKDTTFFEGVFPRQFSGISEKDCKLVSSADDIIAHLQEQINTFYLEGETCLFLSGGMDSAIIASFLPPNTKVFTFKCIADGAIDETKRAKVYSDINKLSQEIIEMNWDDFVRLTPNLLKFDGSPFHSIEVQLLKASLFAKSQGITRVIIGDSADYIFGGMDKLLSKDWNYKDFVRRYNYIEPSEVLFRYSDITDFYDQFKLPDDQIDFVKITQTAMMEESLASYTNAFALAGVQWLDPYASLRMAEPLDLIKIREGNSKYLIREVFAKRYPSLQIPEKIPMPRAMNQWLKDFKVSRPEFIPNSTDWMNGDQKWLIYCLETFLNMHDKGEI